MTCAGNAARKERSKAVNGGDSDGYLAEDTLERVREEEEGGGGAVSRNKLLAISSSQGDEDTEAITTSQYSSSEMANRETCV